MTAVSPARVLFPTFLSLTLKERTGVLSADRTVSEDAVLVGGLGVQRDVDSAGLVFARDAEADGLGR